MFSADTLNSIYSQFAYPLQMILSFELPFALIPLLKFSSSNLKMGPHINSIYIIVKFCNSSSGSNSSTNPERKEVCLFKHHFEFHDDQNPYTRLPFFAKIQNLAKNNPGLMTLRSTDLLPSSWKLDGCCMVTTLSPGVYSKMPLRLSAQRKVGRVQQRYIETTTLKNLKYC
ncbi:hypothetical protein POM88_000490 [Heracleum sosnowskyi]|uniref:Uncharacterized protein n=1 Tax=Heracleum sosnowskyi TaxID=360622 RepID=A0AAD8JEE7_9APIA|nr:hypothetical protein POM88_000490 [Heracleum sosnowskyi]